jgi:hypothetical protein
MYASSTSFFHLQMQQIGLLVFDEAHHCSKDHPYAQIMEDFYHTAELEQRPKVLGLTASPIGLHGCGKKNKKGKGGGAAAASLTDGWDLQQRLAAPLLTVAPELRYVVRNGEKAVQMGRCSSSSCADLLQGCWPTVVLHHA